MRHEQDASKNAKARVQAAGTASVRERALRKRVSGMQGRLKSPSFRRWRVFITPSFRHPAIVFTMPRFSVRLSGLTLMRLGCLPHLLCGLRPSRLPFFHCSFRLPAAVPSALSFLRFPFFARRILRDTP